MSEGKRPFIQKPNKGSLFRNQRKEKDTHPDFTGTLNVEGKEYWCNLWDNGEGARGPRFSLSVNPKQDRALGVATPPTSQPAQPNEDSPVPF